MYLGLFNFRWVLTSLAYLFGHIICKPLLYFYCCLNECSKRWIIKIFLWLNRNLKHHSDVVQWSIMSSNTITCFSIKLEGVLWVPQFLSVSTIISQEQGYGFESIGCLGSFCLYVLPVHSPKTCSLGELLIWNLL